MFRSLKNRNTLLSLLVSLLHWTVIHSAAINSPLHLINELSVSSSYPQNLSTVKTDISTVLDKNLSPTNIDPRLSYDVSFSDQIIDKESAYLNALLALADLSTKGWTTRMNFESIYSLASYGDVTIRIHATDNPSSLMYRYAIWGLYFAIRESSASGFKACVLKLYWSPILGGTRHRVGYVSILGAPSRSMNTRSSTIHIRDSALPRQAVSPELALSNFTTTSNSSGSLLIQTADSKKVGIEVKFERKPLSIDAIFHTIYSGVVYLASMPQHQRISQPGSVEDKVHRTFLRWDASWRTVDPAFQYQHAILALVAVPVYMCAQKQFKEVRFIVYVDEYEVGRGWLYKQGIDQTSSLFTD